MNDIIMYKGIIVTKIFVIFVPLKTMISSMQLTRFFLNMAKSM